MARALLFPHALPYGSSRMRFPTAATQGNSLGGRIRPSAFSQSEQPQRHAASVTRYDRITFFCFDGGLFFGMLPSEHSAGPLVAAGFDAGVRYEERLEQDKIAVPIGPRMQCF